MIHSVLIDDTTIAGKKFMSEFSRKRKGIEFQNPAVTGILPDGYVTGDEFVKNVISGLEKKLKDNGYL